MRTAGDRPLVGVTADRQIVAPHPFHMAGEKYLTAVTDGAGAVPVVLPALSARLDVTDVLARVDGILMTGSPSDLEPEHYGEAPADYAATRDPERDAFNLALARAALERGVPLFAICRGFQELNVALGGSLHQRLADVAGMISHKENPEDPLDVQYGPSHTVNLVDGGLLVEITGEQSLTVNSLHGQGIRRLADDVRVEALADDGLVEAFVVDSAPAFALAVQWHPEWQVTANPASMQIFRAFGDACRRYAQNHR